jgi:sugar lactone lactonase YvrE
MKRSLAIWALLLPLALGGPASAADQLELVNAESFYPEGPIWFHGRLLYTEMVRHRLMVWDGKTNKEFARLPNCGPTSIAPLGDGSLMVTCHLAHELRRVSASGQTLATIDRDSQGRRFVYPNDSISDGQGGAWFSSSGEFDLGAPPTGTIYHLSAKGVLRPIVDTIRYANGVARSADGKRLLVSEHLNRKVLSFRIGADGALDDRRVFFDLADAPPSRDRDPLAGPDGIEVARDGTVYFAEYGAGRILVLNADGQLLQTLPVPDKYVTNVALDDRERTLYITAPSSNTVPPFRGSVWRIAVPLE